MSREVILTDGEKTNGLGYILKDIIDRNLKNEKNYRSVRKLNANAVIKTTDMGVAITLTFKNGKIFMKNGEVTKPDLYLSADFTTLSDICARTLSPFKAMVNKKISIKGSLLKFLKLQKILLVPK